MHIKNFRVILSRIEIEYLTSKLAERKKKSKWNKEKGKKKLNLRDDKKGTKQIRTNKRGHGANRKLSR